MQRSIPWNPGNDPRIDRVRTVVHPLPALAALGAGCTIGLVAEPPRPSDVPHPPPRRGAVLVAGGMSRRMGADKAWLEVTPGVTVLDRTVRVVAEGLGSGALIVVVAAPGRALPALSALATRIDDLDEHVGEGPLPAVTRGLAFLDDEGVTHAYLGGTDAPCLSVIHVAAMLTAIERPGHVADAVVPFTDHVAPGGRAQPLASAVRVGPAARLAAHLIARGERRLRELLPRGLTTRLLPTGALPDVEALATANTPEEWAALVGSAPRSLGPPS